MQQSFRFLLKQSQEALRPEPRQYDPVHLYRKWLTRKRRECVVKRFLQLPVSRLCNKSELSEQSLRYLSD